MELDHHLAVGEAADDAAPEADVEVPAHRLRELRVRVAGEDAHALEGHGQPDEMGPVRSLYPARYGVSRPDVAREKPGYPQAAAAGFELTLELASPSPIRHPIRVVARNARGNAETLAQKSLIPPAAFDV